MDCYIHLFIFHLIDNDLHFSQSYNYFSFFWIWPHDEWNTCQGWNKLVRRLGKNSVYCSYTAPKVLHLAGYVNVTWYIYYSFCYILFATLTHFFIFPQRCRFTGGYNADTVKSFFSNRILQFLICVYNEKYSSLYC